MKLTGANALAKGAALPSMFPFEFGGYRVLSLLGRGGMGAVYEAEQRETGRRVALKVLGHDLDSEDMRKRFLREGRLAAAVTHPNSIYIFGTEEIEGSPVIVMEIAGGGTLKDELKRRGPLPVKEAVDAMLQIIAGLEAAHAGGVLHRDVKPANCFLAPDGTAKVGDFGLSVSTLARQDSQLTASGMMLGTPSFAPPEQLRGDDLDVRADIYSVGATLYTLLTGKAPFDGVNAVQVVANVLDKMPVPVTEHRKEVPAALAEVITRCMAKKREMRFADYAALRDALLPFSSQVPEPAPLGLRFLAGFVDDLIASLPDIALGAVLAVEFEDRFLSEPTLTSFLLWLSIYAAYCAYCAYCAYFVITEGVWGAGIGKTLCGLRVVGPDGNAPGIGRALLRVFMFNALALSLLLPLLLTSGPEYAQLLETGDYFGRWWFWVPVAVFFTLFTTMRRSNGFAALQDKLTGTRVVMRPKSGLRPRPQMAESAEAEIPADAERIGPFIIVQPLNDAWLLGYDATLRRRVWIQTGTTAPTEVRRDVARPGRLRWLAGAAEWNAFEAPSGQSLPTFEPQSQPWAVVRCWLADLAEEIMAVERDGTLPEAITTAQVWITREGRAVLLDVAQRSLTAAADEVSFHPTDKGEAQRFLAAVAAHTLDPKTVPLHARDVLQKLAAGAFERMSFAAGNLQSLLTKPAVIPCRRRAASLLLIPALLAGGFALLWFSIQFEAKTKDDQWHARHPELPPLSAVLRLREDSDPYALQTLTWMGDSDLHYLQISVHIAAHYRDSLSATVSKKQGEDPDTPLNDTEREFVRGCFTGFPPGHALITPEAIKQADARVAAAMSKHDALEKRSVYFYALNALKNILCAIAIIQFISLLVFGVTLGQKVFGFAVVNKKGEIAGRLRMLGRWFIAWVPFMLLFARLEIAAFAHKYLATADIVKCSLYGVVWALCIIAAILRPAQGFHDEQTKTWLVPR